jgi:hypothetical protein
MIGRTGKNLTQRLRPISPFRYVGQGRQDAREFRAKDRRLLLGFVRRGKSFCALENDRERKRAGLIRCKLPFLFNPTLRSGA